jgi:hypothetical protein
LKRSAIAADHYLDAVPLPLEPPALYSLKSRQRAEPAQTKITPHRQKELAATLRFCIHLILHNKPDSRSTSGQRFKNARHFPERIQRQNPPLLIHRHVKTGPCPAIAASPFGQLLVLDQEIGTSDRPLKQA